MFTALVEMAFAGNVGLDVELEPGAADAIAYLFNEELGAVIQVPAAEQQRVAKLLAAQRLPHHAIARIAKHDDVVVRRAGAELYRAPRVELRRKWSELTYRMQALRDDPQCAREAFDAALDANDPGLTRKLTFPLPAERRAAARAGRPKVAVLREQGVNGQREMAATLDRAGFEAHDVHMTDLLSGRTSLEELPRAQSRAAAFPGRVRDGRRGHQHRAAHRRQPLCRELLHQLHANAVLRPEP